MTDGKLPQQSRDRITVIVGQRTLDILAAGKPVELDCGVTLIHADDFPAHLIPEPCDEPCEECGTPTARLKPHPLCDECSMAGNGGRPMRPR